MRGRERYRTTQAKQSSHSSKGGSRPEAVWHRTWPSDLSISIRDLLTSQCACPLPPPSSSRREYRPATGCVIRAGSSDKVRRFGPAAGTGTRNQSLVGVMFASQGPLALSVSCCANVYMRRGSAALQGGRLPQPASPRSNRIRFCLALVRAQLALHVPNARGHGARVPSRERGRWSGEAIRPD